MGTLDRAKRAWARQYAGLGREEIGRRVRGLTTIVRGIHAEGALAPERFAELMGLDPAAAKRLFADLAIAGMQTDSEGRIVGAALTTLKTLHSVRIGNRDLFAWCALDTLFIPGLLGETAAVRSACPARGEQIQLTVTPERIENAEPADAWISVFLPGNRSLPVGPASPT